MQNGWNANNVFHFKEDDNQVTVYLCVELNHDARQKLFGKRRSSSTHLIQNKTRGNNYTERASTLVMSVNCVSELRQDIEKMKRNSPLVFNYLQ